MINLIALIAFFLLAAFIINLLWNDEEDGLDASQMYAWNPQADITAYELAQTLGAQGSDDIENLPPSVRRHWRKRGED